MNLVVIDAAEPLVSLEEAKAHLRVDGDEENGLIAAYIAAASAHIDGPQGILKRAVGEQVLEVRGHVFSAVERLSFGPVLSVVEIGYVDTMGVEQIADAALYSVLGDRVCLTPGSHWPRLRGDAGGVRVRYRAGSGTVPTPVKQAVLLMVGQWFRNRMAVNIGNIVNEMPFGVAALLAPYKTWRV